MQVHRLHLRTTHPDPALPWADGDTQVYAYLVEHPDGLIVVDTGVGTGTGSLMPSTGPNITTSPKRSPPPGIASTTWRSS